MTAVSLTGDRVTDDVVGHAAQIVRAVREHNADAIAAAIAAVQDKAGMRGVHALLLVLAAMVPDDHTPTALLAWLADPAEYRKLRARGIGSIAAGARARAHVSRRDGGA